MPLWRFILDFDINVIRQEESKKKIDINSSRHTSNREPWEIKTTGANMRQQLVNWIGSFRNGMTNL